MKPSHEELRQKTKIDTAGKVLNSNAKTQGASARAQRKTPTQLEIDNFLFQCEPTVFNPVVTADSIRGIRRKLKECITSTASKCVRV